VCADLHRLGDELRQVGRRESRRVVDDRPAFAVRPALRLARNVLVLHGESFDDHSGRGVVEMSKSILVWHAGLLG
jgi:hypothetical protein